MYRHADTGGTVILFPTFYDPEELVAAAQRHRATTLYIVPTIARRLLDLDGTNLLPTLHHLQIGFGLLTPEERIAALEKLTPNLFITYGASGYSTITMLRPDEIVRERHSVGRTSFRTEIEIVDADDRPLPAGADGMLRCRGPGLASAIIGATSDGAEALRGGWYYPGDLARLSAAGYLHLVSRVANIIRRGGTTVIAEEVERVIGLHPGVAEAAVAGRPSTSHGEDVVAYVVARGAIAPAVLEGHCRQHLAPTKVPTEFVFVDALPRSAAGKIMRRALAASAPTPVEGQR